MSPRTPVTARSAALLAGAVLSALSSCGGGEAVVERREAAGEPITVHVEQVQLEQLAEPIPVVGTVKARESVTVASKILSYVTAVHAEEGDRIRRGELLVELDSRELNADLEAAQAAKAEAERAIEAAQSALRSAEAQQELAAATHRRFQNLLEKESVSQQEYDEAAARLSSAEAAVASARSQREQAVSRLSQAEARLASAEVRSGYARIVSPVDGYVTGRLADPGALAAPGAPILRIERADAYELEAAVPEKLLGKLKAGRKVEVRLEALGEDAPRTARVAEVVPEVDPRSRTFLVKLALAPHPEMRSGIYGRALLEGPLREVLTVPDDAIVERGQLRSVFVVEDGAARRRLVTVGEPFAGRVEILSGLTAGETVVLAPEKVRDGAAVRPVGEGGS